MPKTTKTHGGARKGAGRKPTSTEPRTALLPQVRMTPREREQVIARASERGIDVAEAVRTALRLDRLID